MTISLFYSFPIFLLIVALQSLDLILSNPTTTLASYISIILIVSHFSISTPKSINRHRYSQRPEGYDRLGSYAGGSNVRDERVKFFSPTLMRISDPPSSSTSTTSAEPKAEEDDDSKKSKKSKKRTKVMTWPLKFALPGQELPPISDLPEPTIARIKLENSNEREFGPFGRTYAVLRFELAATEPIVRGFTRELLRDIRADGLVPVSAQSSEADDVIVGQFDALFSLNKRRNEVWVELEDHDWQ